MINKKIKNLLCKYSLSNMHYFWKCNFPVTVVGQLVSWTVIAIGYEKKVICRYRHTHRERDR